MSTNQGTKARLTVGALVIGKGTTIKTVKVVTASVTPTNPIASAAVDVQTVTVTGARAGDAIVAIPPTNLEAGVVVSEAFVSANDTVTVRLANPTGSGIATAAKSWKFLWIDLT